MDIDEPTDRPPPELKSGTRVGPCLFCKLFDVLSARTLCRRCTRYPEIREQFPVRRRSSRRQPAAGPPTIQSAVEAYVARIANPQLKIVARALLTDTLGRLTGQPPATEPTTRNPSTGAGQR